MSKRYPGVLALDSVSFDVAPGRVHAVIGENGAGKSTLIKILGGAVRADSGEIALDGKSAPIRDARSAQDLGVAVVHQEFSLAPDLCVAENLFLGRWPHKALGLISFADLRARSEAILESLRVQMDVRRIVRDLSVAHQQMVEIARALSWNARVLVLDEPSAVLPRNELEGLFRSIRALAAEGVSILYISHRLDEVFDLCDDVTVLRDGRRISTRAVQQASREMLIREMVGRPLAEEFPLRRMILGDVVLRVEDLSAAGRFAHVTFEVRRGEVFALSGLVGSGRSSLGMSMFGAIPTSGGRLQVDAAVGPFHSPSEAQRAGIVYLPEDRKRQGLLLDRSLRENVSLAHLQDVSTGGFLNLASERRSTRKRIAELQIKAAHENVPAATLSGGNQQKLMIARWLQKPYRVIILDEPTRGVDVGAKVEIYKLIGRMAEAGAAVIMISSELPEVIGMADRIGVMSRGRLVGVLDNAGRDAPQETIVQLAVGEKRGSEPELPGEAQIP